MSSNLEDLNSNGRQTLTEEAFDELLRRSLQSCDNKSSDDEVEDPENDDTVIEVLVTSSHEEDKTSLDKISEDIINNLKKSYDSSEEQISCKRTASNLCKDEIPKKKKKVEYVPPKLKEPNRDIFCWKCHKFGADVVSCKDCPRVFHFKCTQLEEKPTDWLCFQCSDVKQVGTATRLHSQRIISPKDLSKLLLFVLRRMKSHEGSVYFEKPVDLTEYPDYKLYIVKPMSLSVIQERIMNHLYSNCESFLADARWLAHNSYIFNTAQSGLTHIARALVKMAKHECEEIINCPDCYFHANTLDADKWFIEPCEVPHIIVWAKLKGFPYWPCKVMATSGSNVDVRFFGDHNRAIVPVDCCFLFSRQVPFKQKKDQELELAIQEAYRHIIKLQQKYGEFCYSPPRAELQPNNLEHQRKLLLPGYDDGGEGSFLESRDAYSPSIPTHASDLNQKPHKTSLKTHTLRDNLEVCIEKPDIKRKNFIQRNLISPSNSCFPVKRKYESFSVSINQSDVPCMVGDAGKSSASIKNNKDCDVESNSECSVKHSKLSEVLSNPCRTDGVASKHSSQNVNKSPVCPVVKVHTVPRVSKNVARKSTSKGSGLPLGRQVTKLDLPGSLQPNMSMHSNKVASMMGSEEVSKINKMPTITKGNVAIVGSSNKPYIPEGSGTPQKVSKIIRISGSSNSPSIKPDQFKLDDFVNHLRLDMEAANSIKLKILASRQNGIPIKRNEVSCTSGIVSSVTPKTFLVLKKPAPIEKLNFEQNFSGKKILVCKRKLVKDTKFSPQTSELNISSAEGNNNSKVKTTVEQKQGSKSVNLNKSNNVIAKERMQPVKFTRDYSENKIENFLRKNIMNTEAAQIVSKKVQEARNRFLLNKTQGPSSSTYMTSGKSVKTGISRDNSVVKIQSVNCQVNKYLTNTSESNFIDLTSEPSIEQPFTSVSFIDPSSSKGAPRKSEISGSDCMNFYPPKSLILEKPTVVSNLAGKKKLSVTSPCENQSTETCQKAFKPVSKGSDSNLAIDHNTISKTEMYNPLDKTDKQRKSSVCKEQEIETFLRNHILTDEAIRIVDQKVQQLRAKVFPVKNYDLMQNKFESPNIQKPSSSQINDLINLNSSEHKLSFISKSERNQIWNQIQTFKNLNNSENMFSSKTVCSLEASLEKDQVIDHSNFLHLSTPLSSSFFKKPEPVPVIIIRTKEDPSSSLFKTNFVRNSHIPKETLESSELNSVLPKGGTSIAGNGTAVIDSEDNSQDNLNVLKEPGSKGNTIDLVMSGEERNIDNFLKSNVLNDATLQILNSKVQELLKKRDQANKVNSQTDRIDNMPKSEGANYVLSNKIHKETNLFVASASLEDPALKVFKEKEQNVSDISNLPSDSKPGFSEKSTSSGEEISKLIKSTHTTESQLNSNADVKFSCIRNNFEKKIGKGESLGGLSICNNSVTMQEHAKYQNPANNKEKLDNFIQKHLSGGKATSIDGEKILELMEQHGKNSPSCYSSRENSSNFSPFPQQNDQKTYFFDNLHTFEKKALLKSNLISSGQGSISDTKSTLLLEEASQETATQLEHRMEADGDAHSIPTAPQTAMGSDEIHHLTTDSKTVYRSGDMIRIKKPHPNKLFQKTEFHGKNKGAIRNTAMDRKDPSKRHNIAVNVSCKKSFLPYRRPRRIRSLLYGFQRKYMDSFNNGQSFIDIQNSYNKVRRHDVATSTSDLGSESDESSSISSSDEEEVIDDEVDAMAVENDNQTSPYISDIDIEDGSNNSVITDNEELLDACMSEEDERDSDFDICSDGQLSNKWHLMRQIDEEFSYEEEEDTNTDVTYYDDATTLRDDNFIHDRINKASMNLTEKDLESDSLENVDSPVAADSTVDPVQKVNKNDELLKCMMYKESPVSSSTSDPNNKLATFLSQIPSTKAAGTKKFPQLLNTDLKSFIKLKIVDDFDTVQAHLKAGHKALAVPILKMLSTDYGFLLSDLEMRDKGPEENINLMNEIQETINLTKNYIWCSFCHDQAQFHCCYGTAYCSLQCQKCDGSHKFCCSERNLMSTDPEVLSCNNIRRVFMDAGDCSVKDFFKGVEDVYQSILFKEDEDSIQYFRTIENYKSSDESSPAGSSSEGSATEVPFNTGSPYDLVNGELPLEVIIDSTSNEICLGSTSSSVSLSENDISQDGSDSFCPPSPEEVSESHNNSVPSSALLEGNNPCEDVNINDVIIEPNTEKETERLDNTFPSVSEDGNIYFEPHTMNDPLSSYYQQFVSKKNVHTQVAPESFGLLPLAAQEPMTISPQTPNLSVVQKSTSSVQLDKHNPQLSETASPCSQKVNKQTDSDLKFHENDIAIASHSALYQGNIENQATKTSFNYSIVKDNKSGDLNNLSIPQCVKETNMSSLTNLGKRIKDTMSPQNSFEPDSIKKFEIVIDASEKKSFAMLGKRNKNPANQTLDFRKKTDNQNTESQSLEGMKKSENQSPIYRKNSDESLAPKTKNNFKIVIDPSDLLIPRKHKGFNESPKALSNLMDARKIIKASTSKKNVEVIVPKKQIECFNGRNSATLSGTTFLLPGMKKFSSQPGNYINEHNLDTQSLRESDKTTTSTVAPILHKGPGVSSESYLAIQLPKESTSKNVLLKIGDQADARSSLNIPVCEISIYDSKKIAQSISLPLILASKRPAKTKPKFILPKPPP